MSKMKIGPKIALGFGIIILLMLGLSAIVYYSLQQINIAKTNQDEFTLPAQEIAGTMTTQSITTNLNMLRFLYWRNPDALSQTFASFDELLKNNNNLRALVDANPDRASRIHAGREERLAALQHWGKLLHEFSVINKNLGESIILLTEKSKNVAIALDAFVTNVNNKMSADAAEENMPSLMRGKDVLNMAYRYIITFDNIRIHFWQLKDSSDYNGIGELVQESITLLKELETLLGAIKDPANIQSLGSAVQELKEYNQACLNSFNLGTALQAQLKQMAQGSASINKLTKEVGTIANEDSTLSDEKINQAVKSTMKYVLVIAAISLILAVFVAYRITAMVNRPIGVITRALDKLAEGDFNVELSEAMLERGDELGILVRDLERVCHTLSNTLNDMRISSETVSQSAAEISQGNRDLSNRTQQQASAIEETASALEQMTSSVKNTADHARQANSLSNTTRQVAQQGGEVLNNTIEAMQEVTVSSQKINDIINVVNEIAFQTNLLALNAAVEAARAGEAGKGFAVVAGEVRNLAARSSDAAKEIQTLITDSVTKIMHGNELVARSGASLDEIIKNVQKVGDIINEISTASSEQATGIEEINHAVSQMDQAIQQNAALVEEISAAADNLDSTASISLDQVRRFKTREQSYRQKALTEA